jgi:hypothetical protein
MEKEPAFSAILPSIHKQVSAGADRINARYLLDGEQPREAFVSYWRGLLKHPGSIMPEWHRMVFALLSMIGLSSIKKVFYRLKYRFTSSQNHQPEEPVSHE